MGRASKHSDEYRAQAVELIRQDGWTYQEVAAAADVSTETVRQWVSRANRSDGGISKPLSKEELQDQCKKLQRENKRLRMERDFAKKAAAWFARDENL
jgi:transposase